MPKGLLSTVLQFKVDSSQLSAGVNRVQGRLRGLFQWTRNLRAGALGMNNMLMGSGAVMVGAGIAARSAVRNYEQFSNAHARLRGILASTGSDLRLQTGMMESAEVAARRFGFGLSESTEAMGTLLETGVEAHEAMRYFGTISEFARASNSDLESATQVVVDSMRQFNDQSEEGARRLAATITVAARMSSTSIPQLQQAFRYAGVELSAMGYRADETAAALGALSSIGLRGTTAGTRLRGALLALTRITGRSRGIMREYGLEHERLNYILTDETGTLRPLTEASDQLQSIFQDLPNDAARLNLATALFGRRAYAAGVILAGLHPRAEDFRRTLERLSDSEQNVANMSAAAEENTRGFGAQLRFARLAVQQFGVTFMQMLIGPFEEANGGFGEYLSNLALAVRGSDQNAQLTGAMRREYEQLTPEMLQAGREFRETLYYTAELFKWLGLIASAVGNFAVRWPTLTLGLLAFGSIIRPIIVAYLPQIITWLGTLGTTFTSLNAIVYFATVGLGAFSSTALLLALAIVPALALGDAIGGVTARIFGLEEEYDALTRRTNASIEEMGLGWTRHIPIIGRAVTQVVRFKEAIEEVIRANGTLEAQRETERRRQNAPVEERITGRMTAYQAREERMGSGYARMMASGVVRQEDLQRLAIMAARGGNTESYRATMVRRRLMESGLSEERVNALNSEITQAVSNINRLGLDVNQEQSRIGTSADELARSFRLLDQAFRTSSMRFNAQSSVASGATPAGDVLVGSTGYLPFPVSAGDVLIHRNELANALGGAPGALVQPPNNQMVSATPSGGGGGGSVSVEARIEVPVTIDGREVARAVGTHTLDVDQRRGARIRPGSRRRVAENGVQ